MNGKPIQREGNESHQLLLQWIRMCIDTRKLCSLSHFPHINLQTSVFWQSFSFVFRIITVPWISSLNDYLFLHRLLLLVHVYCNIHFGHQLLSILFMWPYQTSCLYSILPICSFVFTLPLMTTFQIWSILDVLNAYLKKSTAFRLSLTLNIGCKFSAPNKFNDGSVNIDFCFRLNAFGYRLEFSLTTLCNSIVYVPLSQSIITNVTS